MTETTETPPLHPRKTETTTKTRTTTTVTSVDTVVSVNDLLAMQSKVGKAAITAAMASGALPSRLVGGPVGRVTTWSAFLRWAEGHDAQPTGPVTRVTRTDEGVDG